MWLEITATDESGAELLRERRDFGTIMKDAEGDYPAEMWDAAEVYSDDRIPPRESTSNDYTFPMAEGAVTVKAALYYRSCSEEMAEKAGVEIPTTTMAEVTKTVYPSAEAAAAADDETDVTEDGQGGRSTTWLLLAAAGLAAVTIALVMLWKK